MRQIDADALSKAFRDKCVEECGCCPESAKRTLTDSIGVHSVRVHDHCGLIDAAPTIEAIPVEWLREKIKEHTDDEGWQDYLANSFGLCIEEWQKEQEAR